MAEKTEYEKAIDDFELADSKYLQLQRYIESGAFLPDIVDKAETLKDMDPEDLIYIWTQMWEDLKKLQEDRNAKLKVAKDALRQAVVLSPSQQRGHDGSSTVVNCGDFFVSSVTRRFFDPDSLFKLCERQGLLEELKNLTYLNKDGQELPAIQESWVINYERVLDWIKAKNLKIVLNGSYDEVERTPAVKGPKEIAFLGEKKGD